MPAGPEIKIYRDHLSATLDQLRLISDTTRDLANTLAVAEKVVEAVDFAGDVAQEIRESIEKQLTVLNLTKNAGPLKLPSKLFEKVLKAVKPVVSKIEDAVNKLDGAKDENGDGTEDEGQFLEATATALSQAQSALRATSVSLDAQANSLENTLAAMNEFILALDMASDPAYGSLTTAVEAQLAPRNDDAAALQAAFDAITGKIENIFNIIDRAEINIIDLDLTGMETIANVLDFIRVPLDVAYALIKPIEPILNAVGFLVDLVLGPVFDFISNALGLDTLMESIGNKINGLLPNANLLDPLLPELQGLFDDITDFNTSFFDIDDFQVDAQNTLLENFSVYGNVVGNAQMGPTGIGTPGDDTLSGDAGDDILDGRAGDDLIEGGGGNNIFVAGEGNDTLVGGAGKDMVHFSGLFNEYELARDPVTDRIIITHVKPADGAQNEGSETLDTIEGSDLIVFRNITFTGTQLNNAIIGGSVLNGTNNTGATLGDLMFLNSTGTPNGSGQHVAFGLDGDDTIFGSTADDLLNGGNGNDVFIPGDGNDELQGEAGSDTFQILDRGSNSPVRIDLTAGTSFSFEGSDTLFNVENLTIQSNGDHILTGNTSNNRLLSAGGRDVVTGDAGNDFIFTGNDRDVALGGDGVDTIQTGEANDFIFVGGAAVSGSGETYDGGNGFDALSYSNDFNVVRSFIGSDSNRQNAVNNALNNTTSPSGAVRINAETGQIERLNGAGNVIATDTAIGIEKYIGSDLDDHITGALGVDGQQLHIDGAGGNDTLDSNGANDISGGNGDDLLRVTKTFSSGSGTLNFSGGAGYDILDLTPVGDARWLFRHEGSISANLQAFGPTFNGRLNSSNGFMRINFDGSIEEYIFSDRDNEIDHRPGGSVTVTFRLGAGDDKILQQGGFGIFHAGAGNDQILFNGDSGEFFGGAGDDTVEVDTNGTDLVAQGGSGNDLFIVERTKGILAGGSGFDSISFDPIDSANVEIDLETGSVLAVGIAFNGLPTTKIDTTISGFEQVIGTVEDDDIRGSALGEKLIGRAGRDFIDGRDGNDQIFGGAGNDVINGGDGNDRLHGGAGNDVIDGGLGTDAISYAHSEPDGRDGAPTAANFGAVNVDLLNGVATGSFGSDSLTRIENVFGSGGNDTLFGDNQANVLSGEDGDDSVSGLGGNDILLLANGNDTALGGAGNDRFLVGPGNATIDGGANTDTLEFGPALGQIHLDLGNRTYSSDLEISRAVWLDDGSVSSRLFNGVNLTPDMVLETDPVFANSADDLTRVLPGPLDPEFESFRISQVLAMQAGGGEFSDIERFKGGGSTVILTLSSGVDIYNGSTSPLDIVDLNGVTANIEYDLIANTTNAAIAAGDTLSGIDGVRGGSGNDEFSGHGGANELWGRAGQDTLLGLAGNDTLAGGAGADRVIGGGGIDELRGGDGNDSVAGDKGNDLIFGGSGFDTLRGGDGDDTVNGGNGRDNVWMGGGNDLFVDNGQSGANGNDTVRGNGGNDTFGGGAGNDRFEGQDGNDLLKGRLGNDKLFGGNQNDTLEGGDGNDTVAGGNGRDRAFMGNGNDIWFDNAQVTFGDDLVRGGNGSDTIHAGGGNDTLTGGAGADAFIFAAEINDDLITDYAVGADALHISTTLWNGALNQVRLDALSGVVAGDLVLSFDNGDTLTFDGLGSNAGLLDDIVLV